LTTRTKRFIRWKKSATSKYEPDMVKVSGTAVRPGALGAAPVAPASAPPCSPARSALASLAELTAPPAPCAALPASLAAGGAPAAAGPPPPVGGAAGAAAPVDPPAGPGLKLEIAMPVPRAARSSCTSRLGMSSVVGTALPRRMTVA
jgi:hypothetical protein